MKHETRTGFFQDKGVKQMKRAMFLFTGVLAAAALVVAFSGPATAAVTGVCSNCHTMHSSQSPAPSAWTDKGWSADQSPNVALLVTGCVGCHTAPSATQNTGSNTTPYVHQTQDPTYGDYGVAGNTLAGGTFYYMKADEGTQAGDAKAHNVLGISSVADSQLTNTPPGYDATLGQSLGLPATWGSNRLRCAGTYGCHGDHGQSDQFAAISGAHHGDDTTIDGSTVAKSYRFLKGIVGKEWNTSGGTGGKWEYKPTATAHNQYKGKDRTDDIYTGGTDTISYLCAECHGFFHSSDNAGGDTATGGIDDGTWGNWVRHPTDYDMGNTAVGSEYRTYNGDGSTYSVVAPVASVDVGTVVSSVTYSDDTIVTCLSCHRAHGSDYADLLRWDYSGMVAGTTGTTAGTGCFLCHTAKDGA
ncbi:MAG: hypothetical protein DRH17_08570 [Deltaproteobacteria bacterium]|nr:MAG: hypothetical protein DRH17_08570 [Deltaproteobacteria bacterium]